MNNLIEKQEVTDRLNELIREITALCDESGLGEIRATLLVNFGSKAKSPKYRGIIKPENERKERTFPMFMDVVSHIVELDKRREGTKSLIGKLLHYARHERDCPMDAPHQNGGIMASCDCGIRSVVKEAKEHIK